jgi:hypothetical protein
MQDNAKMKKIALFLPMIFFHAAMFAGSPIFDAKDGNVYLCDSLKISYTTSSTTSSSSYSSYSYSGVSYSSYCQRSGYWFWSRTSCGSYSSGYSYSSSSYSSSTSTTTTQHVEDNNSGAADGFQVLPYFPYAAVCDRDVYTATWRYVQALCQGYDTRYRGARTVDATSSTYCWKWNCKPDYAMLYGGECVTKSECTGRGLIWKGTTCEAPSFCSGFTNYDPKIHQSLQKGSCYEYRCSASGKGFRSALDHSCVSVSGRYTRGGTYVNNGIGDDGVVKQCNNNQYNDSVNNRWICKDMVMAPKQRFNECWSCIDQNDLIQCLRSNSIPDGCKLPSGSGG